MMHIYGYTYIYIHNSIMNNSHLRIPITQSWLYIIHLWIFLIASYVAIAAYQNYRILTHNYP